MLDLLPINLNLLCFFTLKNQHGAMYSKMLDLLFIIVSNSAIILYVQEV